MPPREGLLFEKNWFPQLKSTLDKIEMNGIANKPCPPAYIFCTNHPQHYVEEGEVEPSSDFFFSAVNIPTMQVNNERKAMEQEPPVFELWESINMHTRVPHEF